MAGRAKGATPPVDFEGVPADREQWSRSSKQSYLYQLSAHRRYVDIAYVCAKCDTPAVFTALEQQRAFEVKKAHVWQRRVLCGRCNGERWRLQQQDKAAQARWAAERAQLGSDVVFLREWLAVLEALPAYHAGRSGMVAPLRRLLDKLRGAG